MAERKVCLSRIISTGLVALSLHGPDSLADSRLNQGFDGDNDVSAERLRYYADPHVRFNKAVDNSSVVIVGAYGTPSIPGWGSLANGFSEENHDIEENYREITEYFSNLINGKRIYRHADLVLAYGLAEGGNVNIIGKTVEFAEELFEAGDTASFNLRPPATFTVDDLYRLVEGIYTGEAEYADGQKIASQDFIEESGVPLSLDLEEMLRGYPGGIPAVELNLVLERYREIMRGYGYEKPIIILYERGIGTYDMVDDVSNLNTEGLVIVNSGFTSGVDQEENLRYKIQATKDLLRAYSQKAGGCMLYISWFLSTADVMTEEQEEEYVNLPSCALVLAQ